MQTYTCKECEVNENFDEEAEFKPCFLCENQMTLSMDSISPWQAVASQMIFVNDHDIEGVDWTDFMSGFTTGVTI
jgi:hypothetical protein